MRGTKEHAFRNTLLPPQRPIAHWRSELCWLTTGSVMSFGLAFGVVVATVLPEPARAAEIDLGRGPVSVHVPASYDPAAPTPVVVLLHAFTADSQFEDGYMQLGPLADEFGFLYAYPDGTVNQSGDQFWNATEACCDYDLSGVNDSEYLRRLVDSLKARYTVDPRRVFFIGHSNGGFMSHRLACDHSETIAAIASLAGAGPTDPANCSPSSSVHILQIHGTEDGTVPFDGATLSIATAGRTYDSLAPAPGAIATVEQWASINGCTGVLEGAMPGCGQGSGGQPRRGSGGSDDPNPCDVSLGELDLDASIAGAETVITRYADGCMPDGSAELWTMRNGVHIPQLSQDFSRLVIEWLFDHPKVDCNGNGVPDEQDIAEGLSADCDGNGYPDECDRDCNDNAIPDACEIADGTARNLNGNGMPDECEPHLFGDLDFDGDIDLADYLAFSLCVGDPGVEPTGEGCCRRTGGSRRGGGTTPCNSPADLDGDDDVDLADVVIFQAAFTGTR